MRTADNNQRGKIKQQDRKRDRQRNAADRHCASDSFEFGCRNKHTARTRKSIGGASHSSDDVLESEHDCIIRLETERNTYKKLYEDIMNRRR